MVISYLCDGVSLKNISHLSSSAFFKKYYIFYFLCLNYLDSYVSSFRTVLRFFSFCSSYCFVISSLPSAAAISVKKSELVWVYWVATSTLLGYASCLSPLYCILCFWVLWFPTFWGFFKNKSVYFILFYFVTLKIYFLIKARGPLSSYLGGDLEVKVFSDML